MGFSAKERKLIRDWIWQSALLLLILSSLIFLLAGTLRWLWGWLLVLPFMLFTAAQPLLLLRFNPRLFFERTRGFSAPGTARRDRWVAEFAILTWFLSWLLAALDHRLGWSPDLPRYLHWLGLAGLLAGFVLFLWAMLSNPFFAEGVRIQFERGHTVCASGPYSFVRHSGYLGDILAGLSSPLLLGSLWAFIPALLSTAAFVLRTYWEDQTLMTELDGYVDYARRVRWRLFPGVW